MSEVADGIEVGSVGVAGKAPAAIVGWTEVHCYRESETVTPYA